MMVELSLIRDVVAIFGVIAGFSYYVLTVRANQRNHKIATETRQIQYLQNIVQEQIEGSPEDFQEIMSQEWSNFDDFLEKYGIGNNPRNYRIRNSIWRGYNTAGLMLRDGLIDVETYIEYLGDVPIQVWMKYGDIIREFREIFQLPCYMIGMEYLATELDKYRLKKGWGEKAGYQFVKADN